MVGSFRIPLFPPYSRGYKLAKAIYDQLDYFERVEAYLTYSARSQGGGKLVFSGVIDDLRPSWGLGGNAYEVSGKSDLLLAQYSKPFPGELLPNDTVDKVLKSYLGGNELGFGDNFNPFTSGNYVSTNTPTHTSGSWTSATDDGLNVVTCSSGSGAALLSKSGAKAGDRWHQLYVEIQARLLPSSDTSSAGYVGVGLSNSATDLTNHAFLCFAQAFKTGSRYGLNAGVQGWVSSAMSFQDVKPSALTNVDDPQGYIPLTIGILLTMGGTDSSSGSIVCTINGKVVDLYPSSYDPGTTTTHYPFIFYATPATGSATCYVTNCVMYTRQSVDGPLANLAQFAAGSISTSTNSLGYGVDPGATFLEAWAKLATRNGWYLRYTPQAYVAGVRTLGSVDFGASPGMDFATPKQIWLSRRRKNLLGLSLSSNADYLVGDTSAIGQPTVDGGGVGFWRDVGLLSKYGVLQDEVWAFSNSNYNALRANARYISKNKGAAGIAGAKTAYILRDPAYADQWRELDTILINDPGQRIYDQSALVVGKDFKEGTAYDVAYLDQFENE